MFTSLLEVRFDFFKKSLFLLSRESALKTTTETGRAGGGGKKQEVTNKTFEKTTLRRPRPKA